MSSHVCEVWAEQGWCTHTHPDMAARLRLGFAGVEVPMARAFEALRAGMPTDAQVEKLTARMAESFRAMGMPR